MEPTTQHLVGLDQWVKNIPPYAKLLPHHEPHPETPSIGLVFETTSLPSSLDKSSSSGTSNPPSSPSGKFSISSALLSSAIHLPSPPPTSPRQADDLTSARTPLSIPTTTVNFRKFVAKTTPVFWFQDRVEEVILWRKGWRVTCTWMAAWCFICYFPAAVILVPHIVLLSVMIGTQRATGSPPFRVVDAREGSSEWFGNLQAIQNLMGSLCDLQETLLPIVPYLTHSTPYSASILTLLVVTFLGLIPLVPLIPIRLVLLVGGLLPFAITHPYTLRVLPAVLTSLKKPLRAIVTRLVDNDNLDQKHWSAPMKEIELWENERYGPSPSSSSAMDWSKAHLRAGERKGWTRGRDGWSDLLNSPDGDVSSNLTFELDLGWAFVETEDWRIDFEGSWVGVGADDDGWVYTNDAWLDPQPQPVEEWKSKGMTRRRRCVRRIYYSTS